MVVEARLSKTKEKLTENIERTKPFNGFTRSGIYISILDFMTLDKSKENKTNRGFTKSGACTKLRFLFQLGRDALTIGEPLPIGM